MSKVKNAIKVALNTIEQCKYRIVMFEYSIRNRPRDDKTFDNAVNVIYAKLYRDLNDAYSALFMWGNIVPEEAQKEARKAAFKHYLGEKQAIMNYLQMDFKDPSQWYSSEEEEFRKEIEEAKNES